jgi:hypothetical protein
MTRYKVLVDDNFHYMNEDERYTHGVFETADEAVAACKKIVDEFLIGEFKPGMTPAALYDMYKSFGDDPFVRPVDPADAPVGFHAWNYAKERCEAIGSSNPPASQSSVGMVSLAERVRKSEATPFSDPTIPHSTPKPRLEFPPEWEDQTAEFTGTTVSVIGVKPKNG